MYKLKRFVDPIKGQQKFLNKYAQQGYKLEKTGGIVYKFSKSDVQKKYTIQYIGEKNELESKEYLQMLKEMGHNVFRCPYNLAKKSILSFKLRFQKSSLVFQTLNNEVLIIESNDLNENEFDLYNNVEEMLNYVKTERNTLLCIELMIVLLIIFGDTSFSFMGNKFVVNNEFVKMLFLVIEMVLFVAVAVSIIAKQVVIYRYKKESRVYE